LLIGLGGGAAIGLVAWAGAHAIGTEVLRAAWAVPLAVGLHAVLLSLSAMAWRRASGGGGASLLAWCRARWVREAVNSLLPVAQIGGSLAGIRLVVQNGISLARAAAGTVLDLTIETVAQVLFILIGIGCFALASPDHAWRPWLGGGVALMALGTAGFVLAQRAGLMRLFEVLARRVSRVLPALPQHALDGLHAELMGLQRDPAAVLQALALHLLAWLLGVLETWLALAAMGAGRGVLAVIALDSLANAARSAGFAVPGALGVQEGGLVLVGGAFGLPPDICVALSMFKRLRELVVGVGGLLAWQDSETRRLARRARHDPVHSA
jgi:putative membrane protein